MPTDMIHPKIKHHFTIVAQDSQQNRQNAIGVALWLFEHLMTALDGIYPAKNI